MRADAQRNLAKLKAAALEMFTSRGLDTPLDDIARHAGVSPGTLYNRFGSREALIDAIMPDLVSSRITSAAERASAHGSAWDRFCRYVWEICELEAADPALSDIVSLRYPQAHELKAACDETLDHGRRFIEDAQRAGSLRADFTTADLFTLFLANASLIRATSAAAPPSSGSPPWRRNLAFTLDGLRAPAGQAAPAG